MCQIYIIQENTHLPNTKSIELIEQNKQLEDMKSTRTVFELREKMKKETTGEERRVYDIKRILHRK